MGTDQEPSIHNWVLNWRSGRCRNIFIDYSKTKFEVSTKQTLGAGLLKV